VSALLFEALVVAYDVARRTEGAVDPTVGGALEALGYDRDFAKRQSWDSTPARRPVPATGWWRIELDRARRTVRVPVGTRIDLGSSAKALAADRAARRVAAATGGGVLVGLGGDISVAGAPPDGGWAVGIATDSSADPGAVQQVVAIDAGGLATSSTSVRTLSTGGASVHHIVDPATGASVAPHWTLASATGACCVDANVASTAAIVWGSGAVTKLHALGLPARLVGHDGQVVTVNGWPPDVLTPPPAADPRTMA
jgi:thiamine biosynthesis lipoprotein